MVLRVDIIKLDGGHMKKIYSIFEMLLCISIILILSLITIILFVNYNSEIVLVIIAYTCIVLIVLTLIKLCFISNHIIIKDNKIKVFDFPLLATNKFYDKKRSLISYNSEIDVNDIEKIELITLTKEEQNNYIGYKHLLKKYLKFTLKYGNPKFIYVGNNSKCQIKKIIKLIQVPYTSNCNK